MNKPEALRLAEDLERRYNSAHVSDLDAAIELRRLYAEVERLRPLNVELLEALKNYVDGCSLGVNAAEVARAAIAKAEGQR
jgi:hypothetical protein